MQIINRSICHREPKAKLCQIFAMKMRHPVAVFSQQKLGENSVLCAMMHLRQSTSGFLPRK